MDYIILDLVTKTQFIRVKYTEQVGNIKAWSRYMNRENAVDWYLEGMRKGEDSKDGFHLLHFSRFWLGFGIIQ